MPFTILDNDEVGARISMSRIHEQDIRVLTEGLINNGVISGCAVTATGSSFVLTVTAGVIYHNGTRTAVAGNTITPNAAPATGGQARLDVVRIHRTTGVASLVEGIAAAESAGTWGTPGSPPSGPKCPDFDETTYVYIAMVHVANGDTVLATVNLLDKRVMVPEPVLGVHITKRLTADVANSTVTLANLTELGQAVVPGEYLYEALILTTGAAATTGVSLALNGPTASAVVVVVEFSTSATAASRGVITALNAAVTSASQLTTITAQYMSGRVVFTAAGTAVPQFASEVAASAVTAKVGSWARYTRVE